jgi:hypothetical protein
MGPSTLEVLSARVGCGLVITVTNLNYTSVTPKAKSLFGLR